LGRWPRIALAAEGPEAVPGGQNYMPILVKQNDGTEVAVEVRGADTVRVLKTMIQMQLGISEDRQELTFADMVLEDGFAVMDYGVQEGATLTLNVVEETAQQTEDEPEAPTTIDGEPCIRVFVKCEVNITKTLVIPVDVTLTEKVRDLKVKALKEFAVENQSMSRNSPSEYGLFILKHGPTLLADGNLRMLERDERIKDTLSIEDSVLEGGEEVFCANMIFAK